MRTQRTVTFFQWVYHNIWMRFSLTRGFSARVAELVERLQTRWYHFRPHPITEHVPDWCAAHQIECQEILPRRPYFRKPPHTLEPELLPTLTSRPNLAHGPKHLAILRGARIAGPNGIIILPDGSYASESVFTRGMLLEQDCYYQATRVRERKKGCYFLLLNIWSRGGGYYHWLHDGVMRLYAAQERLPAETLYIVPPHLRPWQLQSLEAFGISPDHLVPFSGSRVWELETLYWTDWTTNSGSHDPKADAWFAARIQQAFGITLRKPTRRFFISRNQLPHRRIVNEDAVLKLLEPLGFETVVPEALSLRRQAELFAEAEIVVGAHGSAFTNVYFAPPGLKLLDMVEKSMYPTAPIFWSLCESLGHTYWYLVADSVNRTGTQPDLFVSLDKLNATLEALV